MKTNFKIENIKLSRVFLLLAKLWDYPREDISAEIQEILRELAQVLGVSFSNGAFSVSLSELQEEYTRLFINSPFGVPAPPFASVYRGNGLLCQKPMEEAISFYQQVGLQISSDTQPADHLSYELAFIAHLLENGKDVLLKDFLQKHLLSWFPLFQEALLKAKPCEFFVVLASITGNLLSKLDEEVSS